MKEIGIPFYCLDSNHMIYSSVLGLVPKRRVEIEKYATTYFTRRSDGEEVEVILKVVSGIGLISSVSYDKVFEEDSDGL